MGYLTSPGRSQCHIRVHFYCLEHKSHAYHKNTAIQQTNKGCSLQRLFPMPLSALGNVTHLCLRALTESCDKQESSIFSWLFFSCHTSINYSRIPRCVMVKFMNNNFFKDITSVLRTAWEKAQWAAPRQQQEEVCCSLIT